MNIAIQNTSELNRNEKSKTAKELKYKKCVEKAKDLLEVIEDAKYDLCKLTEKVCNIRIGGHGTDKSIYSIKKFAQDIGMSHHTLNKWMEEYRNVVKKIEIKPETKQQKKIIREVFKNVTSNTSAKEVQSVYNKISKMTPEDHKLKRQVLNAKGIRNFVYEHNLNQLDENDVNSLLNILNDSIEKIKQSKRVK